MDKLNEKEYEALMSEYINSKKRFQSSVRNTVKKWLIENDNIINIPENYLNDFKFYVDGEDEQFKTIKYDKDDDEVYFINEETLSQYPWAFLEEDPNVIESVMNLYFNRPPMFDSSIDDDTEDYGVSEYLEGDADTRTGEIFDNYYGIERD